MGDYRLNVKISLMGIDGEVAEIDWWLNWSPNKPQHLYEALVDAAHKVGLDVEDKKYLFNDA